LPKRLSRDKLSGLFSRGFRDGEKKFVTLTTDHGRQDIDGASLDAGTDDVGVGIRIGVAGELHREVSEAFERSVDATASINRIKRFVYITAAVGK
jgi:hypothetical protein